MVCLSERESKRESTCCLTLSRASAKKVLAKVLEPTGWPRTRRPVVTSTGAVAWGLEGVGAGLLEKVAMVC